MLFNNQLYNRKCFIKRKKELEEYSEVVNDKKSSFVYKNINLEKILDDYNSEKKDFLGEFHILGKENYTKDNIPQKMKSKSDSIISNILNKFNHKYKTRYKIMNIEEITKFKTATKGCVYKVIFYIHEVNKFSTRKLIINFCINKNKIKIISLNSFESFYKTCSYKGFDNSNYKDISDTKNDTLYPEDGTRNNWIENDELNLLKSKGLVKPQEPCKYDIDIWDTNGVNKQVKLHKSCNGINHSNRILDNLPYVNPTIFKLPLPDEGKIPHTKTLFSLV